ncbi:MAG: hypothetical protein QOH68_3467 [Nocardioidaceae bacterium]|nr:hypothetical protein [Nocardioidaceae bacterium]
MGRPVLHQEDGAAYGSWLAVVAIAYAVLHHLGSVPEGFGPAYSGTRVSDWLDLAVPWLVLLPAAAVVRAARAPASTWAVLAVGAVAYASGHGVHLAANSVSNSLAPGEQSTAHLWDEVVGHALWYAGVALVVVALARTMVGRPQPHPVAHVLAVAAGLTWGSNTLGADGLAVPGLVIAIAFAATGWRGRADLRVVLMTGFGAGAVFVVVALATGAS